MVEMDDNFIYYNANPKKDVTEDCVIRAIKTAVGLNYYAVDNLLDLVADTYNCDKFCVCCYHNLLDGVLEYPVIYCDNKETVGSVCAQYPNNKLIIRIEGHLTCSMYGKIVDLWNCQDKTVTCFWIIS